MSVPFVILYELYIMFLIKIGSFIPTLPNTCGDTVIMVLVISIVNNLRESS